ncbi:uncharacterized protein LOC117177409 [Belonocnema kinseyi]|uniref:uncharacterized protein LOC117177409 n=1 Tax=Belonocnema kinseyi TaxID=2817044 RepID=UPI00143DC1A4|nr:uncharacterized protein LOC117177409 [Belonocnema kinseyi]
MDYPDFAFGGMFSYYRPYLYAHEESIPVGHRRESFSSSDESPPRYAVLKKYPIPSGYKITNVKTRGLLRITFGEEIGPLYRITLPARVLVSPDNFIVGKINSYGVLLRLYFTVLYGRKPIKIHLKSGMIHRLSETEIEIVPFHRLIETKNLTQYNKSSNFVNSMGIKVALLIVRAILKSVFHAPKRAVQIENAQDIDALSKN